jgi:hypothetical protein
MLRSNAKAATKQSYFGDDAIVTGIPVIHNGIRSKLLDFFT